jgi:hypothetical protein
MHLMRAFCNLAMRVLCWMSSFICANVKIIYVPTAIFISDIHLLAIMNFAVLA